MDHEENEERLQGVDGGQLHFIEDLTYAQNDISDIKTPLEHTKESLEIQRESNFGETPDMSLEKIGHENKLRQDKKDFKIEFEIKNKVQNEKEISNSYNSRENSRDQSSLEREKKVTQALNQDMQIVESSIQLSEMKMEQKNI